MKKFIPFLLLSFLLCNQLYAQSGQNQDTTRLKYLINSNLDLTYGNEAGINFFNKGIFEYNKPKIGTRLKLSYYYEEEDKKVAANEFRADLRLNIFPKNRLYFFPNAGYEHSLLRLHNLRIYGGFGAAYKLVNNKNNKLLPIIKLLYEYTDYMSPLVIEKDTINKRSNLRGALGWTGSHKVFDNHVTIHHEFIYNQSLEALEDYRLRATIGMTIPVYKVLGFEIGGTINYENVVPLDTKHTDIIMFVGLTVTNF